MQARYEDIGLKATVRDAGHWMTETVIESLPRVTLSAKTPVRAPSTYETSSPLSHHSTVPVLSSEIQPQILII